MINLSIEKAYYDINKPVFRNFNMTVSEGETVSVVGPSGAGKSTLLKIIAGLHKGFKGTVSTDGNIRLAYMPQNEFLLPWKAVYENIVLLAKINSKKIDAQKVMRLIQSLGLEGLEKQYPHKLSGGQYKRTALGQAFFYEPDIVLMDEPFSGLDGKTKRDVQDLFLAMQREQGITAVFVTHDMSETAYMSARVIAMGEI